MWGLIRKHLMLIGNNKGYKTEQVPGTSIQQQDIFLAGKLWHAFPAYSMEGDVDACTAPLANEASFLPTGIFYVYGRIVH